MNRKKIKRIWEMGIGILVLFVLTTTSLTSCEDTITEQIKEEVRLAESDTVFLTVTSTGVGSTAPDGRVEIVKSTPFSISAEAGTDYMLYKWTSNDSGVEFDDIYSANTNVTLNEGDATITANFVAANSLHTLLINSNNAAWGTTDPDGSINLINDTEYSIKAIPSSGYHFTNWTISSGVSVVAISDVNSAITQVKIVSPTPAGAVIQANFALNTYNLVVQQDAEGNGGESGDGTVNDGESKPITSGDPMAGKVFTNWSVVSGGGIISFDDINLPETNVTISAGNNSETVIIQANFSRMLYIAGYEENGGVKHACYWKYDTETGGIEKIVLGNGTYESEAKDIKLYQNGLYIAGTEDGKMCYWEDDVYSGSPYKGYENTNHTTNAVANGIFLYPDAEVYMVGEDYSTPIFYADGDSATDTLNFDSWGSANDIFMISEDEAYVAGFQDENKDRALYWVLSYDGSINATVNLTDGITENAAATSIFQYGNSVFIGGWEGSYGGYWFDIDGPDGNPPTWKPISGYNTDTKVYALCLNPDDDLYLVGEDYGQPTCWNPNNSGQAYLDGGSGVAFDLYYTKNGSNNFYVVGYIDSSKDKAVLWVNPDGTSTGHIDLTDGTTNNARANAVISY